MSADHTPLTIHDTPRFLQRQVSLHPDFSEVLIDMPILFELNDALRAVARDFDWRIPAAEVDSRVDNAVYAAYTALFGEVVES